MKRFPNPDCAAVAAPDFRQVRKWSQVARQKETVRYVVCNGDEGDPGAFMDGSVMEGDPIR